jgi:hypothetical protein
MADFAVEYVGNEPGDIQNRLAQLGTQGQTRANEALREAGKDVKDELENTSPVDTGEYKQSWYMMQVAEDEVWILNEADHAKYVMLPNQKMVNSGKADLPASGILHDVKGVARNHQKALNVDLSEQLRRLIKNFRVR